MRRVDQAAEGSVERRCGPDSGRRLAGSPPRVSDEVTRIHPRRFEKRGYENRPTHQGNDPEILPRVRRRADDARTASAPVFPPSGARHWLMWTCYRWNLD